MPSKITDYPAITLPIHNSSLFDVSQFNGIDYDSVKLTWTELKAELGAFVHNGNSFGEEAVFGTNDNFPVSFHVNGTERMNLDIAGTLNIDNVSQNWAIIASTNSASTGAIAARQDSTTGGTTVVSVQNSSVDTNASAIAAVMENTVNNAMSIAAVFTHSLSSGVPAANIGVEIRFQVDTTTTGAEYVGGIEVGWQDTTHASRSSFTKIQTVDLGVKTNVMSFYSDNILINGVIANFGSGSGCVYIGNASVVPSSNPTGGGLFYVEAGALKYRSPGGTTTTVAPN